MASRLPKLVKLVWRASEMARGPLEITTSTGRTWNDTADGSARAESSNLRGQGTHAVSGPANFPVRALQQ